MQTTFPDDPRATYDALRSRPLAPDERGQWVICRHADVVRVATTPEDFSSAVSRFLQVPNGLDGSTHAHARALLDPFFAPARMSVLEPVLRQIAQELIAALPRATEFDAVADLGARYAVRAQSVWLGWPADLEQDLLAWMDDNHAASRSGELEATTAVAERFDAIIRSVVAPRRAAGASAPDDVTTELVRLRDADGAPLPDDVLVSILRNWTGGDLGSLALCAGVLAYWLASHPELQDDLRGAGDRDLVAAIDEILRIDDPFVSNRRVATGEVHLRSATVAPGDRVVLNWTAANRDPEVFGDPDAFDPHGHAAANLVYGIGPHVCPGRPLATVELKVLVRALLDAGQLRLAPDRLPEREQPPVGGFASVPVVLSAG